MRLSRTIAATAIALSLPLGALADDAKPAATLTPYANLHFGVYWTGGTVSTQDYPGQAVLTGPSATKPVSNGAFLESARASRVGLRGTVNEENWTGASLTGVVEFDFNGGQFPGTQTVTCTSPSACTLNTPAASTPSTSWYNGLMRLRLANVTAAWRTPVGAVSVLAGQDFSVFNGVGPESLGYLATPLFNNAGNTWRRGPLVRASYAGDFSVLALSAAVEALNPVSTAPVDDGSGNQSRRPDVVGRLGATAKPMPGVSAAAGVSFASGSRRFNYLAATQKDVSVSALGVDLDLNLTAYLQLKGEYYAGKGMDEGFNGIAPAGVGGVPATSATTIGASNYIPYRGTGYWGQAILKPIPQLWLTAGMGQAQVNKDDLATLAAAGSTRSKNQMVTAGAIFSAGKAWRFGLELTQTTSTYGGFGSGATARVEETRKAQQLVLSSSLKF